MRGPASRRNKPRRRRLAMQGLQHPAPGATKRLVPRPRVRSSAGEHRLHTAGVTGSIPVAPTIRAQFPFSVTAGRPHPDRPDRPDRADHRRRRRARLCRSRPARPPRRAAPRLHQPPETRHHAKHSPRTPPPQYRRTADRPHEAGSAIATATASSDPTATPSTPRSPPPDTPSGFSAGGWPGILPSCSPQCWEKSDRRHQDRPTRPTEMGGLHGKRGIVI